MDLEVVILSKVSQRQIPYVITYMWTLKRNYTNELIYKTDSQRMKLWLPEGKDRGKDS